ncbi:lysylphosphatidylglycerol biosynthesis bifunctional protein LysX [Corynebacterium pelargi]|uniref:Lysine--tRNA ligase n=2 Tax=Corynebacterium pelargi TaxID=1471400 RepID=A0A410WAG6_9CORY|nr:Lysylphosphatidylglycerol biosynthesis bifunctional protein LysX [Corynebacterium pelargi]GGG75854.1 lysylphosphatidylglycerol biosynthesis bifunctional protein LysX [Corynebacterium pelargi]
MHRCSAVAVQELLPTLSFGLGLLFKTFSNRSETMRLSQRPERILPGYFFLSALIVVFIRLFGNLHWAELIGAGLNYVFPIVGSSYLSALFLVVTAHALVRHKRLGFWLATAFFAVELLGAALLLMSVAFAYEEVTIYLSVEDIIQTSVLALILLALFIVLLRARSTYSAPLSEAAFRRALLTAVVGIAITALLALLVGFFFVGERPTLSRLLRQLTLSPDDYIPQVQFVLALGALLTLVASAAALLFSRAKTQFQGLDEELQLRRLLLDQDEHDADSLGYFATRRDKGVIFSPDAKAAVAYRNVMDSCLAAGDPIGLRDHWDAAIQAFLAFADQQGLAPAAIGTSRDGAAAFARAGMKVRALGDESVVDVDRFRLDNPKLVDVHRSYKRLIAEGYSVRIRRHKDISGQEMHRLIAFADRWRQNGDDRGFSMALGRLGDPLDGDCVMIEALDAEGQTRGLLSFVPWGRTGLSLDVMRRDLEHAANGVTEFMVAALLMGARELGVKRVSLNFAFLRETIAAGEDVGATLPQKISRGAVALMSRKFQIEQLYRSNMKYDPQWLTRYLCWRNSSDLAAIAVALGLAEGQISVPLANDGAREQPIYQAANPAIVEFLSHAKPTIPEPHYPQQVKQKMQRREALLAEGEDPYPTDFQREQRLSALEALAPGAAVSTAGRVIGRSDHGGVQFYRLRDWDSEFQVLIEREQVGRDELRKLKFEIAIGDHIGVEGVMGASRNGTASVIARSIRLTSKALRPVPRTAPSDEEVRVRQRYVDLISNPEARRMLRTRSAIIQAVRDTLLSERFLEVETPLLQTIHGGANARPFRTHINAYNLDLYLRIAPELYLKRLMVGGVDRVFEIGRNFRNEGADATHNPEFTMLEAYQAYGDYNSMRELTRTIVLNAAMAANGHTRIKGTGPDGREHEVDLSRPWRVLSVHEGIAQASGQPITPDTPIEDLQRLAEQHGIDPTGLSRGALVIELHEELSEQFAIEPTFYIDFPTEVSPLTRQHRKDPRVAEKWDLICFGAEVATAYSELIDPVVQRERFMEQSLLAAGGDPEAMEVDEDFLKALEYAMPPSGGMGMGIDRLVMMLCDKNIRQTIAFPLVKPNA